MAVTYTTPSASNGQAPVTVACAPPSGSTFPIGATTVQCTATDSLNRSASCTFPVTVSRTPQLTLTKFLAFGDSVTAGEVSFATGGIIPQSGFPNTRLVLMPSASYPSVLRSLMAARYTAQAANILMLNEGRPGEKARDAATLTRFANAVANNRPDVVLLMHGYNDIEDSSVITDTVNAVDAMAAEARNRRVGRVFMLNLAPGRPGRANSRPDSSIRAFNERLERAARGEGAVYVDIYSALLPDVNVNIGSDGLHPTEAGYRKIADTVLAAVRANLEVR
jgi:lysophospholipase L1-like esterase